jgi:hypothetical protein
MLQVYRDRDVPGKCFDDLKNGLHMKRLHMHTIETVDISPVHCFAFYKCASKRNARVKAYGEIYSPRYTA